MKYVVDCWAHVSYEVEVEADSFEKAKELADCGCGETKASFEGFDVGDSGVNSITDEEGNEKWYE